VNENQEEHNPEPAPPNEGSRSEEEREPPAEHECPEGDGVTSPEPPRELEEPKHEEEPREENIFADAATADGELPDGIDLVEPRGPIRRTCPHCGAQAPEGTTICMECGTHIITGQRLKTNIDEPPDTEPEGMRRLGRWAYLAALGLRRWKRNVARSFAIQRERLRLFGHYRRRRVCVNRLGERVLSLRIEDERLRECYREVDIVQRQIEETCKRIQQISEGQRRSMANQ